MKRIPEEYIHYVWQYGLFDQHELTTTSGDSIRIIEPGYLNHDSGPDFSGAKVQIGAQPWAGNVEIHFKSSDWNAHKHSSDVAYDNVILHVVIQFDSEVVTGSGIQLPTLSLSSYLSDNQLGGYESFIQSKSWIPCAAQLRDVDAFKKLSVKEKMAFERLEQKSQAILELLPSHESSWEILVYRLIAQAIGSKVNAEPFEQLIGITPLSIVRKHADDSHALEALFIGQAGFLEAIDEKSDQYSKRLKQTYGFLRHKYALNPMMPVAWKNARIRPSSAPQIRIAQFARIWLKQVSMHSLFLAASQEEIQRLFEIELDYYWQGHHALGKDSKLSPKRIGKSLRDRIILNVVIPIRFAYGVQMNEQRYKDSALSLLESIRPEDNTVIRKWLDIGMPVDNAFDSQALLQLKKHHCDKKACLSCLIGHELLRDK